MRQIHQHPDSVPNVLLLMESSRQCNREILKGLVHYARLHGPWSFSQQTPSYQLPRNERKKDIQISAYRRADGLILCSPDIPKNYSCRSKPTVAIDVREKIPSIPNIITDGNAIAKMAADYFLNLRLKHFAFCGFTDIGWSVERGDAFRRYLKKIGYTVHRYSPASLKSMPSGVRKKRQLARWLELLHKPVGLFACNDDRGKDVLDACRIAQLKVPDDVAVLGVDNDPMICELTDPPLSSIVLDFEKAGYHAAALLDRMMAGKTVRKKNIIIPACGIQIRRSTDTLAIHDPQVLQAVRFIQQNADKPIRIDDIADAALLSRRTLFVRFRKVLDCTVQQEVRRIRAERIAQMLVETDAPVYQIAAELGFRSPEHISRFFKKEKHLTPLAFREKFKTGLSKA